MPVLVEEEAEDVLVEEGLELGGAVVEDEEEARVEVQVGEAVALVLGEVVAGPQLLVVGGDVLLVEEDQHLLELLVDLLRLLLAPARLGGVLLAHALDHAAALGVDDVDVAQALGARRARQPPVELGKDIGVVGARVDRRHHLLALPDRLQEAQGAARPVVALRVGRVGEVEAVVDEGGVDDALVGAVGGLAGGDHQDLLDVAVDRVHDVLGDDRLPRLAGAVDGDGAVDEHRRPDDERWDLLARLGLEVAVLVEVVHRAAGYGYGRALLVRGRGRRVWRAGMYARPK